LLEIMAEGFIPAGWLGSDDRGQGANKQPHGLSQDELVETVLELWQQGLISFLAGHDITECETISTEEIRNALAEKFRPGKSRTYVCLTSEGGRVWEAFAAPRWDEYISELWGPDESLGQDVTELICANLELLQRYLKFNYPSLSQIDPSRVWWDILEPWEVTNWKTLPKAHRVRFVDPDDGVKMISLSPQFISRPRWYRWD